ncbi:SGNH/GDSL hydrolase family protein [Vagococcus sp. JNUCC 83]
MNNFQKNVLILCVLLITSVFSLVLLINNNNSDSLAASKEVSISEIYEENGILPKSNHAIPSPELMTLKEINEQQILFIGDSITWLDGNVIKNGSKDTGKIIGYQEEFRKKGYNVSSYGVSGSTLSYKNNKDSKSLYYDIVENKKVNVLNKDIIVVFAGTNDIMMECEYGDINNPDSRTTLGALNRILNYINEMNDQAKIYVVSPIYSSLNNRPPEKIQELTNKFRLVSNNGNVRFIDLYDDSRINKETTEKYLYDGLHPNSEGMQVIGEDMLKVIGKEW